LRKLSLKLAANPNMPFAKEVLRKIYSSGSRFGGYPSSVLQKELACSSQSLDVSAADREAARLKNSCTAVASILRNEILLECVVRGLRCPDLLRICEYALFSAGYFSGSESQTLHPDFFSSLWPFQVSPLKTLALMAAPVLQRILP
jgi:hypothetical protein